jgi:hypothetical protein
MSLITVDVPFFRKVFIGGCDRCPRSVHTRKSSDHDYVLCLPITKWLERAHPLGVAEYPVSRERS